MNTVGQRFHDNPLRVRREGGRKPLAASVWGGAKLLDRPFYHSLQRKTEPA